MMCLGGLWYFSNESISRYSTPRDWGTERKDLSQGSLFSYESRGNSRYVSLKRLAAEKFLGYIMKRERPKPFPEDYSNFGLDRPKLSIGEG